MTSITIILYCVAAFVVSVSLGTLILVLFR